MKPVDINSDKYIDLNKENIKKDPSWWPCKNIEI